MVTMQLEALEISGSIFHLCLSDSPLAHMAARGHLLRVVNAKMDIHSHSPIPAHSTSSPSWSWASQPAPPHTPGAGALVPTRKGKNLLESLLFFVRKASMQ